MMAASEDSTMAARIRLSKLPARDPLEPRAGAAAPERDGFLSLRFTFETAALFRLLLRPALPFRFMGQVLSVSTGLGPARLTPL